MHSRTYNSSKKEMGQADSKGVRHISDPEFKFAMNGLDHYVKNYVPDPIPAEKTLRANGRSGGQWEYWQTEDEDQSIVALLGIQSIGEDPVVDVTQLIPGWQSFPMVRNIILCEDYLKGETSSRIFLGEGYKCMIDFDTLTIVISPCVPSLPPRRVIAFIRKVEANVPTSLSFK